MLITDEMIRAAVASLDEAMLASLPDESECDHVFSEKFEKKMAKLIGRVSYYGAYQVLRRVACVFIALVLSATMVVAVHPTARAAVVDWVKEKLEDFYHYVFAGEQVEETPKAYSLGWVPEGYALLDSFEQGENKTFLYLNAGSGEMMQFIYVYGASYETLFAGSGDYEQTVVSVEGRDAELYIAMDDGQANWIVWKDARGGTMFTITGFLSEEEMVKMAESLVATEVVPEAD